MESGCSFLTKKCNLHSLSKHSRYVTLGATWWYVLTGNFFAKNRPRTVFSKKIYLLSNVRVECKKFFLFIFGKLHGLNYFLVAELGKRVHLICLGRTYLVSFQNIYGISCLSKTYWPGRGLRVLVNSLNAYDETIGQSNIERIFNSFPL